jgi:hypothetical protein
VKLDVQLFQKGTVRIVCCAAPCLQTLQGEVVTPRDRRGAVAQPMPDYFMGGGGGMMALLASNQRPPCRTKLLRYCPLVGAPAGGVPPVIW